MFTENKKIACVLNEYFSSVFTRETVGQIPEPKIKFQGKESEKIVAFEITQTMVMNKLSDINANKSAGSDGFHPKFLYEIRRE